MGQPFLIAALFAAAAGIVLAVAGARTGRMAYLVAARRAIISHWFFVLFTSLTLMALLIARNFNYAYVAAHTSTTTPLPYVIGAFWSGMQGSLLLWSFILATYALVVVLQKDQQRDYFFTYAGAVLMVISLFFIGCITFAENPFATISPAPSEGTGINVLLQNPYMLVHPLMLYTGYVGMSVPFAYAVVALLRGDAGIRWVLDCRKVTLVAWMALTAGILLGARWAYYVLGWGGYWAWDPVENASFLPWLVSTAFLHSVMVYERRQMLKVWTVALVVTAYTLSLVGTFLTRSGVVLSVHAFSEGGELTPLLLGFIIAGIIFSAGLLAWRWKLLKSRSTIDSYISKESSFLVNNLILLGAMVVVLWGTVFPTISEAVMGVRQQVLEPYFNTMLSPVLVALLLLMGVCPLIPWGQATRDTFRRNFTYPAIAGIVAMPVAYILGVQAFLADLVVGGCVFTTATLAQEFARGAQARSRKSGKNVVISLFELIDRNRRRYGGYVVHIGIIVIFLGLMGNLYKIDQQINATPGQTWQVGQYTFLYDSVQNHATLGAMHLGATLDVFEGGQKVATITPERVLYDNDPQWISLPAIRTEFPNDLYVVFGAMAADNSNNTRFEVIYNPLVWLVWTGGLLCLLGTIIAFPGTRRLASLPAPVTATPTGEPETPLVQVEA